MGLPFASTDLYLGIKWLAGMANDSATLARLKRSGLGVLAPPSGLQALAAVLASSVAGGASTFAAAPVFWDVLLRRKQPPFFFSEFAPAPPDAAARAHGQARTSLRVVPSVRGNWPFVWADCGISWTQSVKLRDAGATGEAAAGSAQQKERQDCTSDQKQTGGKGRLCQCTHINRKCDCPGMLPTMSPCFVVISSGCFLLVEAR